MLRFRHLSRCRNDCVTIGPIGILVLAMLVDPCCCAEVDTGRESESQAASTDQATKDALRRLARSQFEIGVAARDSGDSVKAAHHFLHAGLNAGIAGDRQTRIDSSHAAQDVVGAVDFSIPHKQAVDGATLSPSEDLLATWSYVARTVHVWSLKTGEPVASLTLPTGIGHVRFHAHKRLLLIGAYNRVVVWPFDRAEPSGEFNPLAGTRTGTVSRPLFHPDGESVLVRGEKKVIWRWSPDSDPVQFDDPVGPAIFGPRFARRRGTLEMPALAASTAGQEVEVFDTQTGKSIRRVSCNGPVLQTRLNDQQREFLTWHGSPGQSTAQLWSLDSDQTEPLHGDDSWGAPGRVILSPDGGLVVAWEAPARNRGYGGRILSPTVRVWSWSERRVIETLTHDSSVKEAWFDPNGQHLATASVDGTVSLWSLRKDRTGRLIKWQIPDGVESVEFHPTQPQLLVISQKQTAQILAIPKFHNMYGVPSEATPLRRFPGSVRGAIFTSNGKRLVTWGEGRIVRVWNFGHGAAQPLLRTQNSIGKPPAMRWLGGDRFVTGGYSGQGLSVWSTSAPKPIWQSAQDWNCYLQTASTDGEHFVVMSTKRPPPSPRRRPDRPVSPDEDQPRAKVQSQMELRSVHSAEPLKVWPVEKTGLRGGRGFRFIDDQKYLAWSQHDLTLEVVGQKTPLREWKVEHWVADAVPFSNGQRLLVTTNTDRYGKGEILVLSVEDEEPLTRVPAESDFLWARLIPDESGVLVWHKAHRPTSQGPAFARLHYFNPERPAVTIENFQPRELAATDFDQSCRFLVGSRFESRHAWLWSAETGELLHEFHRRGLEQTGFDENDIMYVRLDPHGRFAVTWGGQSRRTPGGAGTSMKLWSLTSLQPIADYAISRGSVIDVRDDGTFVSQSGDEVWLLSSSGHPAPLRRLKSRQSGIDQCTVHPETGDVYAQNRHCELFQWHLATWTTADLKRELKQLERRTAQVLDPSTGRLRFNATR